MTIAPTDDMGAHYRQARVFVLPSPPKPGGLPSEGAPTVLMEAMGHGAAVAAARQPGTEEVMGDVGVLVDDLSAEGWASALEPFLADPEMAAARGPGGARAGHGAVLHGPYRRPARGPLRPDGREPFLPASCRRGSATRP